MTDDEPQLDHDLIRRNAEWRTSKERLVIMTTYARRLELAICVIVTTSAIRALMEPLTVAGGLFILTAIVAVPGFLVWGPARQFKPS